MGRGAWTTAAGIADGRNRVGYQNRPHLSVVADLQRSTFFLSGLLHNLTAHQGFVQLLEAITSAWGIFMRTLLQCASFLLAAIFSTSCSIVPDLPPDLTFPMKEILSHTACELQS